MEAKCGSLLLVVECSALGPLWSEAWSENKKGPEIFLKSLIFLEKLVAGAGFEPTTFGL
jgi:hypothetical protein